MKLIVGGYAQGKTDFVLRYYNVDVRDILDGELPEDPEKHGIVVINHFHNWVRARITGNGCPEKEIMEFVENHPDCIIISDEVGNGIVPIDALEREYRERTGRILVQLAERAEEVERVICGIGQKIK